MTKIVLVCDESGAKGYADQDEAFDGEVGVFAGIMVPDEKYHDVTEDFKGICEKYKPQTGKLHIADLSNTCQEELRQSVYAVVRKFNLPCFWYAVHVAGLHHYHTGLQNISKANLTVDSSHDRPVRVKMGSYRENPASMHVALFEGLYAHLIAFLEERDCKSVDIEIKTDQIDGPIINNFQKIAEKLLCTTEYSKNISGFDVFERKVVRGLIKVEVHLPPNMEIDLHVRSLAINSSAKDDPIILGADVLANHLNYIFKNRDSSEKYQPLNCPEAIESHPLKDNLNCLQDWGGGDLIGDGMYKHPKALN